MEHDKVKELYLQYEVLSGSEGGATEPEEKAYFHILSSASGSDKEKTLVAQFIPRFFHRFPELYETALNSYIDLCEDSNIAVRKEAIKGIPKFFGGETNCYSKRFANILTQMLVAEDHSEARLVRDSLTALLKFTPVTTIQGIFLQDSLPEEIPILLGLLLSTSLGKTLSGRKQILGLILSILVADKESLLSDGLQRFVTFVRQATALISISADLNSNDYFLFLVEEMVPRYLSFPSSRDGGGNSLRLLKFFAEIATYTRDLKDIDDSIDRILSLLLDFLPFPLTQEPLSSQTLKKLEFLTVECLLSVLHQMIRLFPNYFDKKQETLRDLRHRLLYFSKASRTYMKVIEETVKNKTKEMERIKLLALKTLTNINHLVKDFFYNPPNPSSMITLSWLALGRIPACKRKSNIEYEKHEKTPKLESDEKQYTYKPPIGKYSQNLKFI